MLSSIKKWSGPRWLRAKCAIAVLLGFSTVWGGRSVEDFNLLDYSVGTIGCLVSTFIATVFGVAVDGKLLPLDVESSRESRLKANIGFHDIGCMVFCFGLAATSASWLFHPMTVDDHLFIVFLGIGLYSGVRIGMVVFSKRIDRKCNESAENAS